MRQIRKLACLLALLSFNPIGGWAGLAPQEVAVLVNANSLASKEVANHFVHMRHVPPQNVIYLNVPATALTARAEISPEAFTTHIWEPTLKTLQERGLDKHVLAWIYSVDFPVRITTRPRTSLMGMTFLRNQFPDDPEQVDKGLYLSPLYAGPDAPDAPQTPGASLLRYREHLDTAMPVPSMMLGHVGARGTTVATVLRSLQQGVAADGSAPRGTVYWHQLEDIRTEMRSWQFPLAQSELREIGVAGQVLDGLPGEANDIIGLQVGRADINASGAGRHQAGSMAEHLTSHAGEFHLARQTKLTDWIRAGATASAGTVTEPYSIWTKFPHARFFPHYARGHTMLESFYLSIRSPTQILLVGEPLARPWGRPQRLTVITLEDGPLSGPASFVIAPMPPGPLLYRIWLNGQLQAAPSGSTQFQFDTRQLPDGYHALRVGAHQRGIHVHSGFGKLDLEINNHGRAITITSPEQRAGQDWQSSVVVKVSTQGDPERIELWHNERRLAMNAADAAELRVDARQLGPGPVRLQARAIYTDGMEVRSPPRLIMVERETPEPAIAELAQRDAAGQRQTLDAGQMAWSSEEVETTTQDGFQIKPGDNRYDAGFWPDKYAAIKSFSVRFEVPSARSMHSQAERIGLIFGAQAHDTFDHFMFHGGVSAWRFGQVQAERTTTAVERGYPFLRGQTYQVDLIFDDAQVTAFVDGEQIATWTRNESLPAGRIGLLAGGQPVTIHAVHVDGRLQEDAP